MPDFRGLFLRGVGGNSAGLGVTQGDAIRNITGNTGHGAIEEGPSANPNVISGAFYYGGTASMGGVGEGQDWILGFDASRVVPTANENRPINRAVRYLIRAKP